MEPWRRALPEVECIAGPGPGGGGVGWKLGRRGSSSWPRCSAGCRWRVLPPRSALYQNAPVAAVVAKKVGVFSAAGKFLKDVEASAIVAGTTVLDCNEELGIVKLRSRDRAVGRSPGAGHPHRSQSRRASRAPPRASPTTDGAGELGRRRVVRVRRQVMSPSRAELRAVGATAVARAAGLARCGGRAYRRRRGQGHAPDVARAAGPKAGASGKPDAAERAYLARFYVFVDSLALDAYLREVAAKLLAARGKGDRLPDILVYSADEFAASTDDGGNLLVSIAHAARAGERGRTRRIARARTLPPGAAPQRAQERAAQLPVGVETAGWVAAAGDRMQGNGAGAAALEAAAWTPSVETRCRTRRSRACCGRTF